MNDTNGKTLRETLNSYYDVELSEQEFSEAEKNLFGFFECLLEIELEQKQGVCNESKNQ